MIILSIVVPTRNRPQCLAQCLATLCGQIGARSDVELIVVDDHSDTLQQDQNRAVCASNRVRHLLLERQGRQSVARNAGINAAACAWVGFIDDDIIVDTTWLETALTLITKAAPDIVGYEGMILASGSGVWDREVQNLHGHLFLTANSLYKKESLLAAGGFDEELLGFCEDHELAVRMLQQGRIVFAETLRGTHCPRTFNPRSLIAGAPGRITNLLRSEYLFWRKHPDAYGSYRYAKTFIGTFRRTVWLHTWISFRRRLPGVLIRHPLQALVLFIVCVIEQLTAMSLAPEFMRRLRNP